MHSVCASFFVSSPKISTFPHVANLVGCVKHFWSTFPPSIKYHEDCLHLNAMSNEVSISHPKPSLIDSSRFNQLNYPNIRLNDLRLITDFITKIEEEELMKEIEPLWKRKKYEESHYDSVISFYREVQKPTWTAPSNVTVLSKMQSQVLNFMMQLETGHRKEAVMFLPIHVLDLSPNGKIDAHVDLESASGRVIGVLSILSSCTVRFRPRKKMDDSFIDLYVPPRSLYIQKDSFRYDCTHEILPESQLQSNSAEPPKTPFPRQRRISLILRDSPTTSK